MSQTDKASRLQIHGRAAAAKTYKQAEEMSVVQFCIKPPGGRTQYSEYSDLTNTKYQSGSGFSTSSSSPVGGLLGYNEHSLP